MKRSPAPTKKRWIMQKETRSKIVGIVIGCILVGIVVLGIVFGVIRERNESDKAEGITVLFVADGAEVSKRIYDFEDIGDAAFFTSEVPDIPSKSGYTGEWDWENAETSDAGITIYAKYTPITYRIVYFADGKKVAEEKRTAEDDTPLPAVPAKDGSNGKWMFAEISPGEIHATAVYYS